MLLAEGYRGVEQNVRVRDDRGNLSELDLLVGPYTPRVNPPRLVVECKDRRNGRPVGLEDVAKFKEVLRLLEIPVDRGVLVTSGRFVPRARTAGVATVDGKELRLREARARRTAWLRRARWLGLAVTVPTAALVSGTLDPTTLHLSLDSTLRILEQLLSTFK
jgi:hypothetical protein